MVGEKVTIKILDRDESGKILTNKYTNITGICTFVGYNDILNVNQITINRMPIFPFDNSMLIKIHN